MQQRNVCLKPRNLRSAQRMLDVEKARHLCRHRLSCLGLVCLRSYSLVSIVSVVLLRRVWRVWNVLVQIRISMGAKPRVTFKAQKEREDVDAASVSNQLWPIFLLLLLLYFVFLLIIVLVLVLFLVFVLFCFYFFFF